MSAGTWNRSVTKIVGFANFKNASVIGVTAIDRGAGVSMIAASIAKAYADFGRPTLLVDTVLQSAQTDNAALPTVDLFALGTPPVGTYTRVELKEGDVEGLRSMEHVVEGIQRSAAGGATVVVDLPPTSLAAVQRRSELYSLGKVCDVVFLICPTGQVTRSDVIESVEFCKLSGIALEGIILNDWKLPASKWLANA